MASKMTLVFLISVTVTLLVVSYFLWKQENQEGFETQGYSVKDLDINACPTFADEIQTAKGSTDCCQGDMVDGKCNGTTFCTKSPAYPGVPSCIDKWRDYFRDKGENFCPPTMPNYYEDVLNPNGSKGCSRAAITTDGKMPVNSIDKQCKIYNSEQENKTKLNSCYVEKQRAKIQCPVVNGQSPDASSVPDWSDASNLVFYMCQYPYELGMPDRCYEKSTFFAYADRVSPGWRGNPGHAEKQICENYIAQREAAREEANRLQAEQRAREAAEAARRKEEEARRSAEELAKKRADEASRLQQQLDEANRRLQNCPR